MNTKRFDISFSGANYLAGNHEIEMIAHVETDHASHNCRLRMDESEDTVRRVWVDGSRSYTPEQEAHVTQLFQYRLPDVKTAIQAWLTEHKFGELFGHTGINIRLDLNLEITFMSYR